jgi:hypothetical protein
MSHRKIPEAKEILKNIPESAFGEEKERRRKAQKLVDGMPDVKGRENIQKPKPDLWRMAKEYLELPENGPTTPGHLPKGWAANDVQTTWRHIIRKHEELMYFKYPEPGTALSVRGMEGR